MALKTCRLAYGGELTFKEKQALTISFGLFHRNVDDGLGGGGSNQVTLNKTGRRII
jgi:hypothetical protein